MLCSSAECLHAHACSNGQWSLTTHILPPVCSPHVNLGSGHSVRELDGAAISAPPAHVYPIPTDQNGDEQWTVFDALHWSKVSARAKRGYVRSTSADRRFRICFAANAGRKSAGNKVIAGCCHDWQAIAILHTKFKFLLAVLTYMSCMVLSGVLGRWHFCR